MDDKEAIIDQRDARMVTGLREILTSREGDASKRNIEMPMSQFATFA
ncbi:MAG: hypothetical protein ABSG46_09655 [Candidatus Binataceae bacterium]